MKTFNDFKGTKGKWTYSKQKGTINHCFVAQVWKPNGFSLASVESTENEIEASANALLISKAPDLLKHLIRLVDRMEENDLGNFHAVKIAKDLINEILD